MKLYSWNVNGIRAIEKKGFVEWVQKEQPDILCIQETKAHKEQLSDALIHIEGYHSYWSSHQTKKGYSGVALYTKEKPKLVEYGIGVDLYDCEGRIIVAEYKSFVLLNIYFPNGGMNEDRLKYKLDFYEEILQYCDERKALGEHIIITGDFNTAHNEIDLKNPKANEKTSGFMRIERDWMDKLFAHGYIDTFREQYPDEIKYSWWSYRFKARERNAGWRIDYFVVSENMKQDIIEARILTDVMGSDHCPVMLEI